MAGLCARGHLPFRLTCLIVCCRLRQGTYRTPRDCQATAVALWEYAMKFGMNLLLWTGHLDESIMPVLERLKSMGYDGVEVPMFELDEKFYADWGKRLDGFGFRRTAVTVRT